MTKSQPDKFQALKIPGVKMPKFPTGSVPQHVAIVMDGNGRWANQRGLTRIEGHKAGEAALLDVVAGAIEAGVKYLTVYAFSTENWKRSPEEVKFLMGFNREVLRARRDQLNAWGVRIRWAGRRPRLWLSVIDELKAAEKLTAKNFLSFQEQVKKWRFLIDMEGIGYSGRLKLFLASPRAVFIQDRIHEEFFFSHLKPWIHYIPVRNDLLDIEEALEKIKSNPELERKIIVNQRRFSQLYLTRDYAKYYLAQILSNTENPGLNFYNTESIQI